MFRLAANEHGWELHGFTVFGFMRKTRDSSFGVPPSGGSPGKLSRPVADRLKPELRTVFIFAPKSRPSAGLASDTDALQLPATPQARRLRITRKRTESFDSILWSEHSNSKLKPIFRSTSTALRRPKRRSAKNNCSRNTRRYSDFIWQVRLF